MTDTTEWQLVPKEPTEVMWGGLARDIVFWMYANGGPHHGSKLHTFLCNLGRDIPEWLSKEIPDVDHTPPKGTVAVSIYKAMLSAAPEPPHLTMTKEEAATFQDWKGMDGACAFHLIERHANGWGDVAQWMEAWLEANGGRACK